MKHKQKSKAKSHKQLKCSYTKSYTKLGFYLAKDTQLHIYIWLCYVFLTSEKYVKIKWEFKFYKPSASNSHIPSILLHSSKPVNNHLNHEQMEFDMAAQETRDFPTGEDIQWKAYLWNGYFCLLRLQGILFPPNKKPLLQPCRMVKDSLIPSAPILSGRSKSRSFQDFLLKVHKIDAMYQLIEYKPHNLMAVHMDHQFQ